MEIKCELCGERVVVADDLVPGQHVRCPFCGGKFSYAERPKEITEDDLREAIVVCRKNDEWNKYYKNAPAGAKLYIALVFYGKVFADTLDKEAFVEAFKGIGPELKERDLRYLLQHEDDEAMREYLSARMADIVGTEQPKEVVSKVSDGRGGSQLGIVRNRMGGGSQMRIAEGNGGIGVSIQKKTREFEEEARGREWRRKMIRNVLALVAVLLVVSVGFMLYMSWTSQKVEEEQSARDYQRRLAEREKAAENEMRAQQEEERARNARLQQKAVTDFAEYMNREIKLLSLRVEESSRAYGEILNDQKRLSEAMMVLESENARRSEAAITNGWKRYDKAELVMMMLKDKELNDLALKYIGEDFSALRSECRGKIKSLLDMRTETDRRLTLNRIKYRQRMEGIEDSVDKESSRAHELTVLANKDLERRLADLKLQKEKRMSVLVQLRKRNPMTKAVAAEIMVVDEEVRALDKEIGRVGEVVAVSRANMAHMAATAAETAARRKGDSALSEKQDSDNAVHSDMAHERAIFNLAASFEGRSLDRICAAMRSRKDALSLRSADAQKKLDFLYQASSNVDMLQPEQLKSIRAKVAARLEEKILNSVEN